jgi:hypothetical protein
VVYFSAEAVTISQPVSYVHVEASMQVWQLFSIKRSQVGTMPRANVSVRVDEQADKQAFTAALSARKVSDTDWAGANHHIVQSDDR